MRVRSRFLGLPRCLTEDDRVSFRCLEAGKLARTSTPEKEKLTFGSIQWDESLAHVEKVDLLRRNLLTCGVDVGKKRYIALDEF